jgi:hypothetical protein
LPQRSAGIHIVQYTKTAKCLPGLKQFNDRVIQGKDKNIIIESFKERIKLSFY